MLMLVKLETFDFDLLASSIRMDYVQHIKTV